MAKKARRTARARTGGRTGLTARRGKGRVRRQGRSGAAAGSGREAGERARQAGRGEGRRGWGGQGPRDWGRSRGEGGAYRESYEGETRHAGRYERQDRPEGRGFERGSEGGFGDYRQGAYGGENEWAARQRYMGGSDQGRADYGGFGRRAQEGGRERELRDERRYGGWEREGEDEERYGRAYYGGRGYDDALSGRERSGHPVWDDREDAHHRLDRWARERYGSRDERRSYGREREG